MKLVTCTPSPSAPSVELRVEHAADEEATVAVSPDPHLGLDADDVANVQSTAEPWGGDVELEELETRLIYRLRFPVSSTDLVREPISDGSPASAGRATVLIVDDEPTLRDVIRRALTRAGHRVLLAEDDPSTRSSSRKKCAGS